MASETFLKSLEVEGYTSKMFTEAGKVFYAATREFNGNGAMFAFVVRDMKLCANPSSIFSYHPHYGPALLWLMDRTGLDVFKPEVGLINIFGYIWRLADAPTEDLELLAANILGMLRAQPEYSMEDETDIIALYASNSNVSPDAAILALKTSPNAEFTKMLLLKLKSRYEETSSDKIKKEIFDKIGKLTIGKYYR